MTVDEYLAAAPDPQRTTLRALRALLADLLPDAQERLSYGMPAFVVEGKAVAGYAHAKRHCGYYPHSGSVLARVEPGLLDGYDWSAGTLRFPVDRPPSRELVARLVEIRLAEISNGGR